jgi:hypothetical protein
LFELEQHQCAKFGFNLNGERVERVQKSVGNEDLSAAIEKKYGK